MTASEYIQKWRKNKVWTHLEWPKHQERLRWCAEQCEGQTLADLGCALGHSTDIMRRFVPGDWTGIDFDAGAVKDATRLFPDITFKFVERPALLNTLGRFDSVVCSEVIEHVKDDRAFLAEIVKLAKWRLILTTPHIDAHDPGHVRIYDDKTLAALLDGYDARVEKDQTFYKVVIRTGE